jgi:hypothetical protein
LGSVQKISQVFDARETAARLADCVALFGGATCGYR